MPRYHNINGERVQFTAAEETARDAEEKAWADGALGRAQANLRSRRNQLLAETDFYALSDVTLSDDMKTYRQELRDLPSGKDTVEKCNNVTKTTTFFNVYHSEDGSQNALTYNASQDLAQSTDFQILEDSVGNDNDQSCVGYLHLFNPSSTTFVKHFISSNHRAFSGDASSENHVAGYFNTTSAIDAVQFKFSSGNIDAGDICLYGLS